MRRESKHCCGGLAHDRLTLSSSARLFRISCEGCGGPGRRPSQPVARPPAHQPLRSPMTTDPADLIPVRALNQVSYCERLYYLEYVESLMRNNEHVEDGLFQHRRVDDPDLQQRPRKEGDALHTRSVQLSSERLGITGKLDLVEEKNGKVYPIEYKRGSGPAGQDGPRYWDNDAVQLCAQGMLLEEDRGAPIAFGILYYIGSKSRVEVPFDDAL